jgi:hypothetical protein
MPLEVAARDGMIIVDLEPASSTGLSIITREQAIILRRMLDTVLSDNIDPLWPTGAR